MKKCKWFILGLFVTALLSLLTGCGSKEEPVPDGDKITIPTTEGTTSELVERIMSRTDLVVSVNRVITEQRFPGLVFSEIDFNTKKARQHAFVAEVDVTKLTIATTTPFGETNTMPTNVNIIPEQAKYLENSGRKVHVAVNGGFWEHVEANGVNTLIRPKHLFWKDGYAFSTYWQDANHEFTVYMTKDGSVDIDLAPNVLQKKDEVYQAIGGLGRLIQRGVFNSGVNSVGTKLCDTHPRTAIGLSEDKKTLYVVVIDGRRTNYADGLNIWELQDFMWGIGSWDAVNFDGGGSSIMVLRDETVTDKVSYIVRNRPSDGSPRKVGNGLAIVEK